MGKPFTELGVTHVEWIKKQRMFFVATAPTAVDGLLNLSPKGLDSFRVIDSTTVAYLDLLGSGVETIAHVKQNGRLIIMFCAFDGAPNILRLWGQGEVVERDDSRWGEMRERGLAKSKQLRWSSTAKHTLEILRWAATAPR